jgi:hypothetical protein
MIVSSAGLVGWLWLVPCVVLLLWMRVLSVVNALAGTIYYYIACVLFLMWILVFLLMSHSLCPPLIIELCVGTILHTVATASIYNTKVKFTNCVVQRVFFSRAREDLTILFAKNNVRRKLPLPREPAEAIPKEGTNLYRVFKLQGAVDWQYIFYADSCLVKIHVILQ